MSMKKIMASVMAGALAVTTMAVAAFADPVVIADVTPDIDVTYPNPYTITQHVNKSLGVPIVDEGLEVLAINVAPGEVYYIDGKDKLKIEVTSVTVGGYELASEKDYPVYDSEGTQIGVTTMGVLRTGPANTAKLTIAKYQETYGKGVIPVDTIISAANLNVVYTVNVKVWDKDKKDYFADVNTDYTSDIENNIMGRMIDPNNKDLKASPDTFPAPQIAVSTDPKVAIKWDGYTFEDKGNSVDSKLVLDVNKGYPATAAANIKYDVDSVPVIYFITEDGSSTGNAGNSSSWANAIRLTNAQKSDIKGLKEDANVTVTIQLLTAVTADTKIGLTTDLSRWHEKVYVETIKKDSKEVTFVIPAIEIYDATYDNKDSSGFLGDMVFTNENGTTGFSGGRISSVVVTYEADDVVGGSKSEVEDRVISVTAGSGEYTVKVTGPMSAIYGNADDLTVNNKITDNSISYVLDLTKNGAPSQLTGEVTLQLSIPKDWQGKTIKDNQVTHKHRDGSSEKLDILNDYKKDGYAVVKTSQFSEFEMEFEDDDNNGDTNTPGDDNNGDTNTPADDNNGGDNGAAGDNGNTNAPTDDKNAPTGVVIAVIPALVAAAGVVISKKRK